MDAKSSKKFFATFDKFMFAGLGCGILALCLLGFGFVYTFRNPPRPAPTDTPIGMTALSTTLPDDVTPTLSILNPTPFPTLTAAPQETIPVLPPVGGNFGNSPPTGKIVFTCFVDQIDQICLMNADGSERKQLTNFDATTFYASLSSDG